MTVDQYVEKVRISESWEEAIKIAHEFFQCPDDHDKTIIRLFRIPSPDKVSAIDVKGITCQTCQDNKLQLDPKKVLKFFKDFKKQMSRKKKNEFPQ